MHRPLSYTVRSLLAAHARRLTAHCSIAANRAFSQLKCENYGSAIEDAATAIKLDPSYPKAYYRRGSAQMALQHFKLVRHKCCVVQPHYCNNVLHSILQAVKDFEYVCRMRPADKDARAKYDECRKRIKQQVRFPSYISVRSTPHSHAGV